MGEPVFGVIILALAALTMLFHVARRLRWYATRPTLADVLGPIGLALLAVYVYFPEVVPVSVRIPFGFLLVCLLLVSLALTLKQVLR
jgi:hypothetical protein